MKNNLITQLKSAFSADKSVSRLSSLRSDKTNADEVIIALRFLLYISLGITGCFGFMYYRLSLSALDVGIIASTTGAVLIAAIVETIKYLVMHRSTRSLVFGWIFKSWHSLFLWGIIVIISVGAYIMSYNVSTSGLRQLTIELARQKGDFHEPSKVLLNQIDEQIADAQKNIKAAENTKWRNTITVDAQRVIKEQSAIIKKLQDQRAEALSSAIADAKLKNENNEVSYQQLGNFMLIIGGKIEILTLLIIFAIVLAEYEIVNIFNKESDRKDEDEDIGYSDIRDNKHIDIKSNPFSKNISVAKNLSVAHCGTGSHNQSIMLALAKLRKETANIKNQNGNPDTIMDRVANILDACMQSFRYADKEVSEKLLTYYMHDFKNAVIDAGKENRFLEIDAA